MDKKEEKGAIKSFIENQGKKFQEDLFVHEPNGENSEVDVGYNNEKFQVTLVPAGVEEIRGRLPKEGRSGEITSKQDFETKGEKVKAGNTEAEMFIYGGDPEWVYQEYIKKSIENKECFDSKNVILLIYSRHFLQRHDIENRFIKSKIANDQEWINSLNWESIYFVSKDFNFKIK